MDRGWTRGSSGEAGSRGTVHATLQGGAVHGKRVRWVQRVAAWDAWQRGIGEGRSGQARGHGSHAGGRHGSPATRQHRPTSLPRRATQRGPIGLAALCAYQGSVARPERSGRSQRCPLFGARKFWAPENVPRTSFFPFVPWPINRPSLPLFGFVEDFRGGISGRASSPCCSSFPRILEILEAAASMISAIRRTVTFLFRWLFSSQFSP